MRWLTDLLFRIRALFRRRGMDKDLSDEVAFHLDMQERKYRAEGLSPKEARRKARVKFGGVERQKEHARDAWGVTLLHDIGGDVRFAGRQLIRRPAFSVLAVSTLALGIGGTVALFSMVYGLLLRPLPVADESKVVAFWSDYNWRGVEFDFAKEGLETFESVAAFSNIAATLRGESATLMVELTISSAELFDVLGARPLLGRAFQPGDDRPGAEPVIVLGHGLWQEAFGGDRDIVGRQVTVDGSTRTVVGVMPEAFYFPSPQFRGWVPLNLDPADSGYQRSGWLVLVGRVANGASPERVQADLDALGVRLGERFQYPERWDKSRNPAVTPLRSYLLGEVRPAVLMVLGAVTLLLLMACANVTALILTRTMDRTGEITVRAALGAGRGRLARQILTESLLLGLVGGVFGVGLAIAAFDVLVAWLPLTRGTASFAETLTLDWSVLIGALGLATVVGALISLAPIRTVLSGDLTGSGLGQRRETGLGFRGGRLQHALVVSEVVLAVVLVTGAGLLARSVDRLRSLDPGIEANGVLAVDLYIGEEETTAAERARFFEAMLERTRALPGVTHAGLINRLPIRDGGYRGSISIPDRPDLVGDLQPGAYFRSISPGALEALGVTPLEGRTIRPSDSDGAVPAAMVNESFVKTYWEDGRPIGRHFETRFSNTMDWEVVGVIPDMAMEGLVDEIRPAGYHPWGQASMSAGSGVLLVRVDGDESQLAAPVRAIAREVEPRAAVGEITSMGQVVDDAMSESLRLRFFLVLFSVLGLVLGAVGIYGVVAYGVERRRGEYGLRMALGAEPGRLLAEVVGRGMVPVVLGVAVGLAVALVAARAAASMLYEIAPSDPVALGTAAVLLLLAGASAAAIPALRASRTHPGVALRGE